MIRDVHYKKRSTLQRTSSSSSLKSFTSSLPKPTKPKPKRTYKDLSFDILEQIFTLLIGEKNDAEKYEYTAYQNLFSCILVNKAWAAAAVPLMWKHPFRQYHQEQNINVLTVYLSSLDATQRSILKATGITLNRPNGKLTFPYGVYLKHLNYRILVECAWAFCERMTAARRVDSFLSVLRAFLQLLSRSGASLRSLQLCPTTFKHRGMYTALCSREFAPVLSHIKVLELDGRYIGDNEVYHAMSTTCLNLDHLILRYHTSSSPPSSPSIRGSTNVSSPKSLIQAQKKLSSLTLHNYRGNAPRLCAALTMQKSTLRHVTLKEMDFEENGIIFRALTNFAKLESLTVSCSYNLTATMVEPLWNAQMEKLKYVKIVPVRDSCLPGGEHSKVCKEFKDWAHLRSSVC